MGRRKWKLYQDGLLPRRKEPGERSSDEESMPASEGQPPALKIKTIEQINAPGEEKKPEETNEPEKKETILESLIRKPATQPKVDLDEPVDWKPSDKCYFCVDGERGEAPLEARPGGATSPASESDSSCVSEAKSPAATPQLLQHLLQLQAQNPQAIAQFQQMMAALAALGTGLVPPALQQAWLMQRLVQSRQVERISSDISDKVPLSDTSPSMTSEQPLDLSAKSSSTGGSPPPPGKTPDNNRLKSSMEGSSNCGGRRAYSEEELQCALRDIQSGKLGTRRAAVVYGIPRSTLRNKVYKMAAEPGESEPDSDERDRDSPHSVILKIPTFPAPDDKSPSPAAPATTPITPILPPPQPHINPASQLLLPPSVFADPPSTQHLFTSISDVIAKSISQKFQQPLDRPPQPDLPFMRAPDRHVSVIKQPDNSRNFSVPSNSRVPINNNGQPAQGGKGTRPKRGKYRNYDRDSLVEAVKAVQRGEMSVHRAGSYYGVPHSTLEYKVKERHLMRPRKREPKPQPDAVKPQAPKPPPPKPPVKPFTNGMNGPPEYGAYPFWAGGGFAPPPSELYASHMMRRLREEAPPANGSFLEGIIRSQLERPLVRRAGSPDEAGPARRPRLEPEVPDRQLAAELRDAVQRLRADKLRRSPPPDAPPDAPPH